MTNNHSEITIVGPKKIYNRFYKFVGALILILNKIRHGIKGYTTPRTFPMSDYEKAITYDMDVVDQWLFYLSRYSSQNVQIEDKNVLELGPGADLGVGLYLLFKGVSKYNALDVNNLIKNVPKDFYDHFFKRLTGINLELSKRRDIDYLLSQLEQTLKSNNDRLNFICRKDFGFSDFKKESIDIVFSQAAFEHFDNFEETARKLNVVTKPGGILISVIDLQTHSRWIRDKDPLNIYRYSQAFYKLFEFLGSPNRLRPFQYEQILKENGWKDIQFTPQKVLDDDYLKKVEKSLNTQFRGKENEMGLLSTILCATKE